MPKPEKKETEFSAVITTSKAVADKQLKGERQKGHKARLEKRPEGWHVLVEIPQPKPAEKKEG